MLKFTQMLSDIYWKYLDVAGSPMKQLEALKKYMEIVTKIISPIQGGLKLQCLVRNFDWNLQQEIKVEKEIMNKFLRRKEKDRIENK